MIWLGAWKISTASVVGLLPLWQRGAAVAAPGFRWCGIHTPHQALGTNKMSFTAKALYQNQLGSDYRVTITSSMTNSQTTVTFSSNTPVSGFDGTSTLYDIAAGDEILIDPVCFKWT
jgi:hypothetical protein